VRVLVDYGQTGQTNSRTAVPEDLLCNDYTLTFTAGGKPSVTFSLTESAGEVALETGTWTLILVGRRDGTAIAESDPLTVTVGGEPVTVTVPVHPVKDGPPGEFYYRISAEGLSDVSAALQGVGNAGQSEIDLNIGEEASVSVAPGYYRLMVRASLEGQRVVRREMIHIYPNTRTYKTYELTEEDFTPPPPDYEGIKNALESAVGGDTTADPIPLKLHADLTDGGWESILSAVASAGKYVALDLSTCIMDGTQFAPGTGNTGAAKVVDLVLPDAAKSIQAGNSWPGTAAFKDFTVLEFVSGAGVETVGYRAFYSCDSLVSVNLPVATSIGDSAFYWCMGLESVSLPAATFIGGSAFGACYNLVSVDLPVATSIGDLAFVWCDSLTLVALPVATSIGNEAFAVCDSLESVALPAATSISYAAFSGCDSLVSVSLPVATSIGDSAFYWCKSLTSIALPVAISIGERAFEGCESLASIALPAATSIGNEAFASSSLVSVSLPAATSIGDSAFYKCASLASVSLPAATSIGGWAFGDCNSLASVNLPASLMTIDGNVFSGCVNLTTITVDPANPAFTARTGMLLDKAEATLIAYPSASGNVTLPGIITIGYAAFLLCASLSSVDLPAATDIGERAFEGCESLASIALPAATSIGNEAFLACWGLASVDLPAVTSIGDSAFGGTSLTSVDLPSATSIGDFAFGNTSLTSVDLPVATSIGDSAFSGTNLAAISLPVATSIGDYAFSGTSLASVDLPVATSIGDYAFSGTNLASVSLPATPPSIGSVIFSYTGYDNSGIITISVPTGAVSVYTSAWGVDAETPAGGNTDVYGDYHKAVLITDAAQ
jgi:hypothetical protein